MSPASGIRKRLLRDESTTSAGGAREIDICSEAAIAFSSEHHDHPVEQLFDGRSGPGGTRWLSARPNSTEQILVEFDKPQSISRLIFEAEETDCHRTQEVRVEVSFDAAQTYSQILVQEYVFSPGGATFQREDLRFNLEHVSHLRLTIVPNKSGSGTATLTSLRLFS